MDVIIHTPISVGPYYSQKGYGKLTTRQPNTVQRRYNANFLPNPHKRHPIARPWVQPHVNLFCSRRCSAVNMLFWTVL